jgi:hypothetical protein
MKLLKQFSILILWVFMTPLNGQVNKTQSAIYNIGTGAVLKGIGAMINKTPDMPLCNTFLKGFYKGAIGGFVIYESKNLSSLITKQDELAYNWFAKTANGLGTSMVENAATNKQLLEQINFNIGFNRIECYTKQRFKVRYKILPISLLLTGYVAWNHKFEIEKSLQTGEFIFSSSSLTANWGGYAYTLGTAIAIDEERLNTNYIINHEIMRIKG